MKVLQAPHQHLKPAGGEQYVSGGIVRMLSVIVKESPGLHASPRYTDLGPVWFQRAGVLRREAMHQNACTGAADNRAQPEE